jgi:hypothetical protein
MNQMVAYQPTAAANLTPQNLTVAMDLAKMMAGAKLVPEHLQGKPADCLLVIEQAVRWGMSPFAVAQATSVIGGKLMYEGKLVAAAINASGILSDRLSYEFSGEGQERQVKVKGTIRGESAPREATVCFKDVKTGNGMWTKQRDQQLVYSGARVWGRRHVPEVMLGVYTPEEFDEAPRNGGSQQPQSAAPLSPPPAPKTSVALTEQQWLEKIWGVQTREELRAIGLQIEESDLSEDATARLGPPWQKRLKELKAAEPKQEPIVVKESQQGRGRHDPKPVEPAQEQVGVDHLEHFDPERWLTDSLDAVRSADDREEIAEIDERAQSVRRAVFPSDWDEYEKARDKALETLRGE